MTIVSYVCLCLIVTIQTQVYWKSVFEVFLSNTKWGLIYLLLWTYIHEKAISFRGLRPRDPLTRGSAPGARWGLRPHTPVIGSHSRARHGLKPPQSKFSGYVPALSWSVSFNYTLILAFFEHLSLTSIWGVRYIQRTVIIVGVSKACAVYVRVAS